MNKLAMPLAAAVVFVTGAVVSLDANADNATQGVDTMELMRERDNRDYYGYGRLGAYAYDRDVYIAPRVRTYAYPRFGYSTYPYYRYHGYPHYGYYDRPGIGFSLSFG